MGGRPTKIEWLLNGAKILSTDPNFELGILENLNTRKVSCAQEKYRGSLKIKKRVKGKYQYQVYTLQPSLGLLSSFLSVTGRAIVSLQFMQHIFSLLAM